MHFVHGLVILLSQCLLSPRNINGYWQIIREASWNAEGSLKMDWHPVRDPIILLLQILHTRQTGIISGCMGLLTWVNRLNIPLTGYEIMYFAKIATTVLKIFRWEKSASKESMQQCWGPSTQPWRNSRRKKDQFNSQLNLNISRRRRQNGKL